MIKKAIYTRNGTDNISVKSNANGIQAKLVIESTVKGKDNFFEKKKNNQKIKKSVEINKCQRTIKKKVASENLFSKKNKNLGNECHT